MATKKKTKSTPAKAPRGDRPAKKARLRKVPKTAVAGTPPPPTADTTGKKLSALDAAALVLAETDGSMNCPDLIAAMAAKGYWMSPAGKTPAATLYAAISKEIGTKGAQSRFRKTGRGQFERT